MARSRPTAKAAVCKAALLLAEDEGWQSLTLEKILRKAKISAKDTIELKSKESILPLLVEWFDQETADAIGRIATEETPRDRLFEVMMARFDVLQAHREGILAILADTRKNPRIAGLLLPEQMRSMKRVLDLAHISDGPLPTPFLEVALLAAHLRTLFEWQRDKSTDMAKTMATLDKSLRVLERLAKICARFPLTPRQ